MKRAPRLAVLVMLVLVAVLPLTGCGGGDDTGGTSGGSQAAQPATPPAPPGGEEPQIETAEETRQAEPFTPNAETPKWFRDLVELGTPLMITFHSTGDEASLDVIKAVDTVEARYSNQAEFPKVKMDDAFNMDALSGPKRKKAEEDTILATQLGVQFMPHVIIMDRNSMITYSHAGYIDAKTLEQELFKALKR